MNADGSIKKYYETLKDAVEAAQNGDTIQLVADETTNQTITIDKNITLDLNGHTYTSSKTAIYVNNDVNFTLEDNKGAGTINVTSSKSNGVTNMGKFIMKGGTIAATGNGSYGLYNDKGAVTIAAGSISGTKKAIFDNKATTTILGKEVLRSYTELVVKDVKAAVLNADGSIKKYITKR